MTRDFFIDQTEFNLDILTEIRLRLSGYEFWPLVYLLSNNQNKTIYIGETTNVLNRMTSHLRDEEKSKMSKAHLIVSDYFNKSAALDIEANLINYMLADGVYKPINANLGVANHQYYQKREVYQKIFRSIWDELRSLGIARHSLEHIDNSDLFKYSPYKSLSIEQVNGLKKILESILNDEISTALIEGGAGTGKSILAIFLFKLLKTDLSNFNFSDFDEYDTEIYKLVLAIKEKYQDIQMALVIPMSSFRKTISNVFRNIQGLSASMVVGPSDIVKKEYDLLIIDESHRLRRRVGLGPYFKVFDDNSEALNLDKHTSSELEWALTNSKKQILFYDSKQSIRPSDVLKSDFDKLKLKSSSEYYKLQQQYRVKGGVEYVNFINKLLDHKLSPEYKYKPVEYEAFLYEDLNQMVEDIKRRESDYGLSRLVAGYAWEWVSKNNQTKFDIEIEDVQLKWNSVTQDWVNSKNANNEVGCIHTIQGYDLNYTGVIIGPEIGYDKKLKEIIIYKDKYKDRSGKLSIKNEEQLKKYIINIYKTILLRGINGTFIYISDLNLREYFAKFLPLKKSIQIKKVILLNC